MYKRSFLWYLIFPLSHQPAIWMSIISVLWMCPACVELITLKGGGVFFSSVRSAEINCRSQVGLITLHRLLMKWAYNAEGMYLNRQIYTNVSLHIKWDEGIDGCRRYCSGSIASVDQSQHFILIVNNLWLPTFTHTHSLSIPAAITWIEPSSLILPQLGLHLTHCVELLAT